MAKQTVNVLNNGVMEVWRDVGDTNRQTCDVISSFR